jgi:spore protease
MFFRTDMAVERRDLYRNANKIEDEINGIECEEEKKENITITRVKIKDKEGEKALNKKKGNYITIDVKKIHNISIETEENIIDTVTKELKAIIDMHVKPDEEVLVVGLGNLYSTPDSLGSKVVQNIEITRHIKMYLPNCIDKNTRSISAVTPGVLGTTGIESLEIVKGIVENVKPKLIIAIDSLCSKNIERINKSIQISDTGIVPGGGVRK